MVSNRTQHRGRLADVGVDPVDHIIDGVVKFRQIAGIGNNNCPPFEIAARNLAAVNGRIIDDFLHAREHDQRRYGAD